jgi:hypothetical protein
MQQNKAQLELQFNWIFVLIVGAILLTFFFTLIGGQSKSNEEIIAINFAERMKTILDASEQQPGTIKLYERLPPLSLTFTCDAEEDVYNYVIRGADSVDTKYNLFFSPRELNKNEDSRVLYTWTLSWSVPYEIASFLYITNDRHDYVFYNDSLTATDKLYEDFPKNFSHRFWTANEPDETRNMDTTTYIFFRDQLTGNSDLNFLNNDGKIIIIEPALGNDIFSHGTLYFLRVTQASGVSTPEGLNTLLTNNAIVGTSAYLGKASLYGAIFSENRVHYECAMNKAMHRLRLVTHLQYYRTQEIYPEVSTNCKYLLNYSASPASPTCITGTGAGPCLLTINQSIPESFTKDTPNELFTYLTTLDRVNDQLATLANCPPLY